MVQLVFGKYEIQQRLAIGGMGEVFYALQKGVPGFERPVILKSLLPELAREDGFIEGFLDEARVAATLNHPNVVSIFEVGQWNGTYYLAMEYIRGRNLWQLMRRTLDQQMYVPPMVATRIIRDAALGLDHAHRATDANGQPLHIVHRDISPQNIMVREDGLVKVVDFGIARAANRSSRTATGALKGKLAYMAPEQFDGGQVGPAVDQFALGVVLWELLSHLRFNSERDLPAVRRFLSDSIPLPLAPVRPHPLPLLAVVMRMLERDRAKRFPSCAEVAIALEAVATRHAEKDDSPKAFMRSLGDDDLFVRPQPTPNSAGNFVIALGDRASGGMPPQLLPPQARRRARAWVAVPVALASIAVAGYFAFRRPSVVVEQPPPQPTPSQEATPGQPVPPAAPLPVALGERPPTILAATDRREPLSPPARLDDPAPSVQKEPPAPLPARRDAPCLPPVKSQLTVRAEGMGADLEASPRAFEAWDRALPGLISDIRRASTDTDCQRVEAKLNKLETQVRALRK